jgi:hypothetical protein
MKKQITCLITIAHLATPNPLSFNKQDWLNITYYTYTREAKLKMVSKCENVLHNKTTF